MVCHKGPSIRARYKPCFHSSAKHLAQELTDLLTAKSTSMGVMSFYPGGWGRHRAGGLEAGPEGSGWWLLWQAVLQPSPAHQVMSNRANINVNVLLSVVKSVFVVLQFIFSLPAPWMLSADMSGWYPLPKIHTLSTFLRSWAFPPSLWHADVKFLPGSVIHKTLHTYQIMSLTFQGQKLSVSVRHRVDVQAWFGVGAKGGRAF